MIRSWLAWGGVRSESGAVCVVLTTWAVTEVQRSNSRIGGESVWLMNSKLVGGIAARGVRRIVTSAVRRQ